MILQNKLILKSECSYKCNAWGEGGVEGKDQQRVDQRSSNVREPRWGEGRTQGSQSTQPILIHEIAHTPGTPTLVLCLAWGLPFLPSSCLPREEPCAARPSLQAASFPPVQLPPHRPPGWARASAKWPAWSLLCQVLKWHSHQKESCSPSRQRDLGPPIDCLLYQPAESRPSSQWPRFNRWEWEAVRGYILPQVTR